MNYLETKMFETIRCPACNSDRVNSLVVDAEFPYGEGSGAVSIPVKLRTYVCNNCELEFLDSGAEELKHEAVCRHLGIHTPREIVAIRNGVGLSRSKFAQITKIGEATLGRWERGVLTQNPGYDQFLFLLGFPENVDRLINRQPVTCQPSVSVDDQLGRSIEKQKFRSLGNSPKFAIAVEKSTIFRLYNPEAA